MSERPKLKDVVEELHDVKTQWKAIGIQLEVPTPTLRRIESTHKNDPEEAFSEMMYEWLNQTDPEPTWSAIVKALRSRSVGASLLAGTLERNKCPDRGHDLSEPLLDVAMRTEDSEEPCHSTELQMLPNHTVQEVPPQVRQAIKCLAKSLNNLRIHTYRHVEKLEVTPDELRVIVCNPERHWEGDDHKCICLAKTISTIFAIVSHRRYLNWQNYDLLEEIIEVYGDSVLKGKFEGYCKEVTTFENKTLLDDVKNIVFTPLGSGFLMKVPIPNGIKKPKISLVRAATNGFKRNGYPIQPHCAGQNSPLAIFFIVPRQRIPPTSLTKINLTNPEKIEDRVMMTLSEEDAALLMDLPAPPACQDEMAPPATLQLLSETSIQSQNEVFKDDILHKGSTTVVCKGTFNHLPCAAKYVHKELATPGCWQNDQFRMGCDFLRSSHHPNIVMFLGLELHHDLAHVLLTELMDESLEYFLNRSEEAVPIHMQIDIGADVAQGLDYIHAKGYIYGDLNASNVLLKGGRAKIGGLMALMHKSTADVERSFPPGSPPCMPMRSFSFSEYNELIDCFSYGVLAIHIAIREAPSPTCTSADFALVSETERYETSIDKIDSSHPIHPVILDCIREKESERPSAAALANKLSAMKETHEYKDSRQSSESMEMENKRMKNRICEQQREKNVSTIEFKRKEQQMKEQIRRKNATAKALRAENREKTASLKDAIKEKDDALQRLEKEKAAYQEMLREMESNNELCLLAMNFVYHITHQDCETAKHKAQSLSDKEKEAKEKMTQMEIIAQEKTKLVKRNTEEMQTMTKRVDELQIAASSHTREKRNLETQLHSTRRELDTAREEVEEREKKMRELRHQRISTDESYAKLLDQALDQGLVVKDT